VYFVNNVFSKKVFSEQFPKELIELGMPERKEFVPPAPALYKETLQRN
jgi:hypothetical protein